MKRLTEEQIDSLWERYSRNHVVKYRDEIITHYLPLVKYVVGRIIPGLPSFVRSEDLYSTGVMGLIKAVDRFDTLRKTSFSTYAVFLIKGAIIDELRALDWIPRSVHSKSRTVEDAKRELQHRLGREATKQELAEHLGIDIEALEKLLVTITPPTMTSLDEKNDGDDERVPLAERIPDANAKLSSELVGSKEVGDYLFEAIKDLPEQERLVLSMYYYEGLIFKDIGRALNVSESRISQVHTKAVGRLRKRMKNILNECSP